MSANGEKNENDKEPIYVFGPVPSRRLGRSLGVDLIPFKSCTLNCVYCQIGRTSNHSIELTEHVPMVDVLAQIKAAIDRGPMPDYITLAGSGEPTLYSKLGELIDGIRDICDVPIDIITNGTMLWDDEVFDAVCKADLILPSFDAGDEASYKAINRPADGATFERLVAGLSRLSETCPEKVWLEVFVVNDVNDTPEQMSKIARIVKDWKFSRIQLNTAVRPPAEDEVKMVSQARMEELAELFDPPAEIIADFSRANGEADADNDGGDFQACMDSVLAMLSRRPCTLDDIVAGMGAVRNEVIKALDHLVADEKILMQKRDDKTYYLVRSDETDILASSGSAQSSPVSDAPRAKGGSIKMRIRAIFVLILVGSLIGAAIYLDPQKLEEPEKGHYSFLKPCSFLYNHGYPCPTCYMTRAFSYMYHGRPDKSFLAQPFGAVLSLLVLYLAYGGVRVLVTGQAWRPFWAKWSRLWLLIWLIVALLGGWLLRILYGIYITHEFPFQGTL